MMTGSVDEDFICPLCNVHLSRNGNYLICKKNENHIFEINSNIVSFIASHEFDNHWEPHSMMAIPESKAGVAKKFLGPLLQQLSNQDRILDVGCGDGVHAKFLKCDVPNNLEIRYIGLDVSLSALHSAQSRVNSDEGTFIHADAAHIPLADASMDAVFSYGVIAYTNDPSRTIQEMSRVLKPSGIMGIWVYLRPPGFKGWLFNLVRKVNQFCGPRITQRIADIIVPFLGILPVASGLHLGNASWKQCREVVLVNIAPKNLIFPEKGTVKLWLAEAGLTIILEDLDPPLTIWAKK